MVVIVPDPPGSADTLGLPYLRRSRSRTLLSHREPFVPSPPLFESFLQPGSATPRKESMRFLFAGTRERYLRI